MKLSLTLSAIPVILSCINQAVLGYPIQGYNVRELSARDMNNLYTRFYALELEQLAERGVLDKIPIPKIFKPKPLTPAQEAERKLRATWKAQHAFQKHVDRHLSTMAKIENGGGKNHRVEATWKGPGEAEHGKVAHKKAQDYWQKNPDVQKFKHAEVSAQMHTDGRIHTTARYHNGGASFSGATVHLFSDAKGRP